MIVACLAWTAGCDDASKQAPRPVATQSGALTATTPKEYFAMRCAGCHGAQGRGDGPSAATLSPKPRNFADREWQRTVTDEQIRTIVVKGGLGVGKNPIMPGNEELLGAPQILDGLVLEIRGFGR